MSQENNKRPSFQFYPADWLSDPNTNAMTAEEEGAYIRILCYMWNTEDCSLREDEEYLARLGRVDKVVIRSLYPCFKVVNRRLRHKRLDYERIKQNEYREKCSMAGKKGMSRRWKGAKEANKNKVVITKDNSSTSTSTSTSTKEYPTDITPTAVGEYGKRELNQLHTVLAKELGVADFMDTQKKQRIYLSHLYNFIKKQPDPNRWFKKACQKIKAENFTVRKLQTVYNTFKTYIIK